MLITALGGVMRALDPPTPKDEVESSLRIMSGIMTGMMRVYLGYSHEKCREFLLKWIQDEFPID